MKRLSGQPERNGPGLGHWAETTRASWEATSQHCAPMRFDVPIRGPRRAATPEWRQNETLIVAQLRYERGREASTWSPTTILRIRLANETAKLRGVLYEAQTTGGRSHLALGGVVPTVDSDDVCQLWTD